MKQHNYSLMVNWTGNNGYKIYKRSFEVLVEGKEIIKGSSDPAFNGDITKYNPEELLLAAISSCHMLWYLHLCADDGIIVTNCMDNAEGIMIETNNGSGKFEVVILKPVVTVANGTMIEKATWLHANPMNFVL